MPVKRTGIVAAVSSPTRKSIVTPSAWRRSEPRRTMPPIRTARSSGSALRGDVAGRVEEARLAAQRRHGEQHRAADRDEREQRAGRGAGSWASPARCPARRPRPRRGASPPSSTAVSDERRRRWRSHRRRSTNGQGFMAPPSASAAPRPWSRASSARIRISTIAPNSKREAERGRRAAARASARRWSRCRARS